MSEIEFKKVNNYYKSTDCSHREWASLKGGKIYNVLGENDKKIILDDGGSYKVVDKQYFTECDSKGDFFKMNINGKDVELPKDIFIKIKGLLTNYFN